MTGENNIVKHNLVATVYWAGTAEPEYAEFNTNNDGAIMSRDAVSVVMTVCILFIEVNEFQRNIHILFRIILLLELND